MTKKEQTWAKTGDIYLWHVHCESGEGLWLQGEAALQTHSFRNADPQPVIPPNGKKNHGMFPKLLRPGINISLTTTDPCLVYLALHDNAVIYITSE